MAAAIGHMHDQRMVGRAALGGKDLRHGRVVVAVGGQAVDRFGGQAQQLALLQGPRSGLHRGVQRSIQNHVSSLKRSNAEDVGGLQRSGAGLLGRGRGDVQVAHLAGALGIDLAVQVQVGAGQGQDLLPGGRLGGVAVLEPQVAQQVQHHGGAVLARLHQGQVGHAAHLQLKLRHIQRVLAVVAAVVRARGDLVDHQLAVVQHKEFHAQHAHVVEADGSPISQLLPLAPPALQANFLHTPRSRPECRRGADCAARAGGRWRRPGHAPR